MRSRPIWLEVADLAALLAMLADRPKQYIIIDGQAAEAAAAARRQHDAAASDGGQAAQEKAAHRTQSLGGDGGQQTRRTAASGDRDAASASGKEQWQQVRRDHRARLPTSMGKPRTGPAAECEGLNLFGALSDAESAEVYEDSEVVESDHVEQAPDIASHTTKGGGGAKRARVQKDMDDFLLLEQAIAKADEERLDLHNSFAAGDEDSDDEQSVVESQPLLPQDRRTSLSVGQCVQGEQQHKDIDEGECAINAEDQAEGKSGTLQNYNFHKQPSSGGTSGAESQTEEALQQSDQRGRAPPASASIGAQDGTGAGLRRLEPDLQQLQQQEQQQTEEDEDDDDDYLEILEDFSTEFVETELEECRDPTRRRRLQAMLRRRRGQD